MVERGSALWQRGTNFMDKILKGGCFILTPRYSFLFDLLTCGKENFLGGVKT